MIASKKNVESLTLQKNTQDDYAFHHKFFSKRIAQVKTYLLEREKTSRGLTAHEKNQLDEINYLIASGFDINISVDVVMPPDAASQKIKIQEYKEQFANLSKEELLTRLAEQTVKLEAHENMGDVEANRFEFLLNFFDKSKINRVAHSQRRRVGKNSNKSAVHVTNKSIANEIIQELKKSKTDESASSIDWFYASIDSRDFKIFCRKMRARCKPAPAATTLRNYFKQLTGLSSTK